jgi:hypothetical protein
VLGTVPFLLGGGAELPRLLFLTNKPRLVRNVGEDAFEAVSHAIQEADQRLVNLPVEEDQLEQSVLGALEHAPDVEGVVLLGGHDVMPHQLVSAIPHELRQNLEEYTRRLPYSFQSRDEDDYKVWSDDFYGDTDGNRLPELPVSRIPDCKSLRV